MDANVAQMRMVAARARVMYNTGRITRQDAKKDIMPYIVAVNATAVKLAEKHKTKPKKVSFENFVR